MIFQQCLLAAIGDRMKVQRESLRLGQQNRRQILHPRSQQLLLLESLCAIRVISSKRLFWQYVQSREQPKSLVQFEVIDVAEPFLTQQLERQQTKQRRVGWDHFAARISRGMYQRIKPHPRQQWKKQEHTRDAGSDPQRFFIAENQRRTVGNNRNRSLLGIYR